MKGLKFSALAALLFLTLIQASVSGQSSLFGSDYFIGSEGDTMNYRILVSDWDTISKYPLVIFLHGAGECGDENEAQLKWGVQNFASNRIMKIYRPIVVAPQLPCDQDWDSFSPNELAFQEEPAKYMKILKEYIDRAISEMPIDPDRVYITGLSMGGYGTFDAIMRYPDTFAAAFPVCGAGDPKRAASIAHIPIWIAHGARDPIIPPILAQKMLMALTEAGAHPGFTQYPHTGHFSWLAAYDDPMIMDWLFSQRR